MSTHLSNHNSQRPACAQSTGDADDYSFADASDTFIWQRPPNSSHNYVFSAENKG